MWNDNEVCPRSSSEFAMTSGAVFVGATGHIHGRSWALGGMVIVAIVVPIRSRGFVTASLRYIHVSVVCTEFS